MANAEPGSERDASVDFAAMFSWDRCTHEGIGRPGCSTCDPDRHRVALRVQFVERQKAQKFFAAFADEMRKPHFGEMQRDWMKAMLTRAQEAGLYRPEAT